MKALAFLACLAVQWPATALTLQCGGSVRLPDTLYAVTPRLAVDGAETIAIGEDAATGDGVRFKFRAPGKGLLASGEAMLAAMVLGAEGVQIGTLFALTQESGAHEAFKRRCLDLNEGDTKLLLRKLSPTRLVKGGFYNAIEEAENRGASSEELLDIIGIGKTKVGIFDGDIENGELEIGQGASLLKGNDIEPVAIVMQRLVLEYEQALASVSY